MAMKKYMGNQQNLTKRATTKKKSPITCDNTTSDEGRKRLSRL